MRYDHAPAAEELSKSLFGGRRVVGAFPLAAIDVEKQPPFPPRAKDEDEDEETDEAGGAEGPPAEGGDWGGITLDEAERRMGAEGGEDEDEGAEPGAGEAPGEPEADAAPVGAAPPPPNAEPGAAAGAQPDAGADGAEAPGAPPTPAPEGPMDEEPQGQPAPPGAAAAPAGAGATTIGNFLSSTIHSGYTLAADRVFGAGYLTREERIALSSAISRALQVFDQTLQQEHPELYGRTMPTEVALSAHRI